MPKLRAERDRKHEEFAACESVPKVIALDPAALTQYAATVYGCTKHWQITLTLPMTAET